MNNLLSFENQQVEVLEVDGTIYFNPYHVANILGIKNVRDNLRTMNENQAIKLTNSGVGNTDIRKLNNAGELFLTESGVYKLIFKSRKPNAEKFADWVTDEVLPTIRKTGKYEAKPQLPTLTRKTFKGKPVMIVEDLATLLGSRHDTTRTAITNRKNRLPDYQVLRYAEMDEFKLENGCIDNTIKHLAIFGKPSALAVLAYYGRNDLVPVILNYFKPVEQKQIQPPKKKKEPEKPIPYFKMDMAVKILSAMPDGEFKENACKNLLYDIMGEGFMRSTQFIGFANELYNYLVSCPEDIRREQAEKAMHRIDSLTPKAAFFFRQAVENANAKV